MSYVGCSEKHKKHCKQNRRNTGSLCVPSFSLKKDNQVYALKVSTTKAYLSITDNTTESSACLQNLQWALTFLLLRVNPYAKSTGNAFYCYFN